MQMIKRMILGITISMLVLSGSMVTLAQANTETLQNIQQELDQKAKEKQLVNKEIENIQKEVDSLNTYISENKAAMENTQKRISTVNQLIEEKKEGIVILEDKIHSRKEVMKNRLVALQNDNNLSVAIKVLIDAKDFDDFIQRASAVSALFNADKNILIEQQNDLKQIEEDKKEIDRQQLILKEEENSLAKQQEELNQNLKKKQDTLSIAQERNSQIDQQMEMAQQEKESIEAKIKEAQEKIRLEQAEAARRAAAASGNTQTVSAPAGGLELYVSATAYSPEESGSVTRLGYNIQANPNMKLIAVDPSVIPLGKRVWVEGYGEAIAGDTGSAIIGHKIDVLMPTKAQALSWGRKVVKIVILN